MANEDIPVFPAGSLLWPGTGCRGYLPTGVIMTYQPGRKLKNQEGNTEDMLRSVAIEDDCPVLTVDDGPLQAATSGSVTPPGLAKSITLVFDASSTHPTRICEIEITVHSSGVAGGGIGDISNKGETDVDVEARPVGAQQDQDDASTDDDDAPQNQEQVTSDNFLMFPTLVTPMAILWAALVRAREE